MTPEAYVASHPITMRLRELGVTDEQLSEMRFRNVNAGLCFDQWPFTWGAGTPIEPRIALFNLPRVRSRRTQSSKTKGQPQRKEMLQEAIAKRFSPINRQPSSDLF
jgi:hypothetical protein